MTLAIAIEKRLKTEIARALEIMERVRDRPEGLNRPIPRVRPSTPVPWLGAARSSDEPSGTDKQRLEKLG